VNVLVLNAGSSSLKFQVIATDLERIREDRDKRLFHGSIDYTAHNGPQTPRALTSTEKGIGVALQEALRSVSVEIEAVGHRVVHGGERFSESVRIDDAVVKDIEECVELAPLHDPASLEGIRAARARFGPELPQVAVFDTAFHHTLPEHGAHPARRIGDCRVSRRERKSGGGSGGEALEL